MTRRSALLLLSTLLLVPACSSGDDDATDTAPATTPPSVFVSAVTTILGADATAAPTSPSSLPPVALPDGDYDAQLTAVAFDPPQLGFFRVEIRTGKDAQDAWAVDHPSEPWPGDSDYYIFIPDKRTMFTAQVTDDAVISVRDPDNSAATIDVTMEQLITDPRFLRGCKPAFQNDPVKLSCSPWKVTIEGGRLVKAVEEFTP